MKLFNMLKINKIRIYLVLAALLVYSVVISPGANTSTVQMQGNTAAYREFQEFQLDRIISGVAKECRPSRYNFLSQIIESGKPDSNLKQKLRLGISDPEGYSEIPGVTCFRGNNYRNSATYGYAKVKEAKLKIIWSANTGYIDTWTGVGWNGQPAIIKWDMSVKSKMNIYPDKKSKPGLKEVVYATLDGKIYFMDLDDGKATRPPINVGAPLKGSAAIDPRGYPLLYTGQGIDSVKGRSVPIGFRIYSLVDGKRLFFLNGLDKNAFRFWGAFDSTPLVDKENDTLIECGENGILYIIKLNSNFNSLSGSITIKPDIKGYRYKSFKNTRIGTENSPAVFRNLIYFCDNSGILQCVDLNSLKPVWVRDVTDDTDSSIVLEEDVPNNALSLYTACEVDHQGKNGFSYIRKINAFTGSLIWEKAYKCLYDTYTNGGALATPVLGKNDIKNLIIYNIAKTDNTNKGKLLALDKVTGKEVWTVNFDNYSWSSPVDFYTESGKGYIVFCDSSGIMYLIDGKKGRILDSVNLAGNVEGSPAIYENMVVVGTRGQKIWGIKIK